MSNQADRDILLDRLHARVERLETELARARRRRRYTRRLLPTLLAALLVALVPLATLAANPFVDLTGGPHDGNIDAIYGAGITKGCDPTHYCPTDTVTRQEMASFLARTAGLGGNPPIANALTAQTAINATNATNAQNAVNAQTAVTAQTATNAAQLGERPAAEYARTAQIVPHTYGLSGGNKLPLDLTTITPTSTRALMILSGSGYRTDTIGELGISALLFRGSEGQGLSATGFTNELQSHKTVVSGMTIVSVVPGATYTIRFNKDSSTVLNDDDALTLTILELP